MDYPRSDFIIETDELQAILADANLRIIDCRIHFGVDDAGDIFFTSAEEDWAAEHIPGATHVHIAEALSDRSSDLPFMLPSAEDFTAVMSRLGVGDGKRVVLYDGFYNIWAARVWWMLRAYGYTNAAVLNGGFQKWKQEKRPVVEGRETPRAATFRAEPTSRVFVDKQAVLSAIAEKSTCLVDALPADQYSGESPVWVHRPGHIKSAANIPFNSIVDEQTHAYLPAEQLAEELATLGLASNDAVVTYCHAGNAASSVAFAMALMGNERVSIYDGSLREWTADPDLPMETSVGS